jgi:hypothetical protein
VNFSGEPVAHLLCHCLDCRKITGATYSNNLLLPEEHFKLESGMFVVFRFPLSSYLQPNAKNTGKPKIISKKADSGKDMTSYFCGDCGTTLYRTGDSFPGQIILKAGVLDDINWLNEHVPKGELFVSERLKWTPAITDADQMKGMPS